MTYLGTSRSHSFPRYDTRGFFCCVNICALLYNEAYIYFLNIIPDNFVVESPYHSAFPFYKSRKSNIIRTFSLL